MSKYYNQNYTKEEIISILNTIKSWVKKGRYIFSLNKNRLENQIFINEYNLFDEKRKSIILRIEPEDFCHSLRNTKKGYQHETLYVFVPQIELLTVEDKKETVDIYTKINILHSLSGEKVIVISFHKCNKPVAYLFR